ncbi:MAG: agmatinase family protein [Myxococcales bacterium]
MSLSTSGRRGREHLDPNAAAAPDSGAYGLFDTPEEAKVVLLPVPFEATTSYGGGTAAGPEAILAASRQVDLFDIETQKPYEAGISWLPVPAGIADWNAEAKARARPVIDAGGVDPARPELAEAALRVDVLCERMNEAVRSAAAYWAAKGKVVGTVGGDHSIAFGAITAAAAAHPGLGILHLDAHADLRHAYEGFAWSHASILENVARRIPEVARIVQVGIRDLCEEEQERIRSSRGRIVTHYDAALSDAMLLGAPFSELCASIAADLPPEVYLSFDIDGLDPALCPHTGTPVPGGLSFREACFLLRTVAHAGKRIIGFDLTEVSPGPPTEEAGSAGQRAETEGRSTWTGDWDANVGARLLYKMIGWSLYSISKE